MFRFLRKILVRRYGILVVLLVIVAALSVLRPELLSMKNLYNLIQRSSVLGILAVGMTFVMASGGIDLSVGSILAFTGVIAALMMNRMRWPVPVSICGSLLVASAVGAANGFLSSKLKYHSLIVTLGTMYFIRGATMMLTDGVAVWPLPSAFIRLSDFSVENMPVISVLLVLIYLAAHLVLTKSYFGRQVFAIGGNQALARVSGVKVDVVVISTLSISGLLSGIAGLITAARLTSGQPMVGQNYELEAIAACVVGGASMSGGRASIWRTLVGVFIVSIFRNAFSVLGFPSYMQMMVIGAIVIGSLAIEQFRG